MCRHKFSNPANLGRFIAERLIIADSSTNRALVVIEMAQPHWLKIFADTLSIPYIDENDNIDRADKITALLGTENRVLAHAVSEPLDAGLLAALSGTVANQGVLILGVPYFLEQNPDEKPENFLETNKVYRFTQRFKNLLAKQILKHPMDVFPCRIQDLNSDLSIQVNLDSLKITLSNLLGSSENDGKHSNNDNAIIEQEGLLTEAIHHLRSHEKACVTIIGKRGRGKSSLLARVANYFQSEGFATVVTAHNRAALGSFHKLTDHDSKRYVLPIEKLNRVSNDILLVDEAGNLSIDALLVLLKNHKKIVLCTTVEGYENAGRAFETRFLKSALDHDTSLLALRPTEPWRWLKHDPIEELLDELLLNTAASNKTDSDCELDDLSHLQIRRITQQELTKNESLLRSIHTLLRDTHYQNSVKDLQHLLDGEFVQIWTASEEASQTVIAVVLVSIESDIEPSLHNDILNKQRRLPHQLLLQLLAQSANTSDALSARFARIIRISVNSRYRRQGVATTLLKALEQQLLNPAANEEKIQALGASFANDIASQQFWSFNGYRTFHEGFKKNPRTGSHAVAVLKTVDQIVSPVLDVACRIHEDNCHSRKQELSKTTACNGKDSFGDDLSLLQQFSKGYRSVHDTHAALSRLALTSGIRSLEPTEKQSRRAFEKELKQHVSKLINN